MPFPDNDLGVGTRQCRLLRGINQDTAVPLDYNNLGVGTRQCRLLRGINPDTAVPFPYQKKINRAIVTSITRLILGNGQH